MANYIVRLQEGKEIVGIFSTISLTCLFAMVDEVTDPLDCEYRTMDQNGGIVWPFPGEVVVPLKDDDMPEDFFARAEFTHWWGLDMFEPKYKWKPFEQKHNPFFYRQQLTGTA